MGNRRRVGRSASTETQCNIAQTESDAGSGAVEAFALPSFCKAKKEEALAAFERLSPVCCSTRPSVLEFVRLARRYEKS